MRDVTIPAGQWRGDPPGGELTIQPTGVMAGIEPGWVTVTGWRRIPGELARRAATVQILAAALPPELLPEGTPAAQCCYVRRAPR